MPEGFVQSDESIRNLLIYRNICNVESFIADSYFRVFKTFLCFIRNILLFILFNEFNAFNFGFALCLELLI